MSAHPPPEPANLDPDEIAGRSFERNRKGFDEAEVRAYLISLASQLRNALNRQADLERRVAEQERRNADPADLDIHQLTVLLGEETTRVLEAARTAADQIRAKAEDSAGRLVREANEQATSARNTADEYAGEVRSTADREVAIQREAADEYATRVRTETDTAAGEARASADAYALEVRSAADADVQALRAGAEADAERMRAEAETVLDERTTAAEAEASHIRERADEVLRVATEEAAAARAEALEETTAQRQQADTEVAELRTAAQAEADDVIATARRAADERRTAVEAAGQALETEAQEAAATIKADAREEGRAMVEEARAYRERVLADLAERRRQARIQLEELRDRRDDLLGALSQVGVRVAAAGADLTGALPDPAEVGDAEADRRALRADGPLSSPALPPRPRSSTADDPDHGDDPSGDLDDLDGPGGGIEVDVVETVIVAEDPATGEIEAAVIEEVVVAESERMADPGPSATTAEPVVVTEPPEGSGTSPSLSEAGPVEEPELPARGVDAIFASLRSGPEGPGPTGGVPAANGTGVAVAEREGTEPGEAGSDEAELTGDEALLARRDGAVDEIGRQLARKLKRRLSDEQNEVLDRLRRAKGAPDVDAGLPSAEDHVAGYRSAVTDELRAAAQAGVAFYGTGAGGAVGDVVVDVDDLAGELGGDLVGQLRGRLERAFADGGDEIEVGERIRACYREWKTERIADAAEDAVLSAFGRGVFAGAPAGTAFRWLVDDGDTPCPDCDDDALAGDVTKGQRFPTGATQPPAHPGCRCLIVPVP